jgi:hypothetical protein
LAFSLGAWGCIFACIVPQVFALVILIKHRFIMCYEDEAETTRCFVSLWHSKGRQVWELVPIVVPNMEALLVLAESFNKFLSVVHNVDLFVAINIHSVDTLNRC